MAAWRRNRSDGVRARIGRPTLATIVPHTTGAMIRIAGFPAPRAGLRSLSIVAVLVLLSAAPASAQYGFLGSLGNRFSDLSFFANVGGLSSSSEYLRADRMSHFGMEILFTVSTVTRPTGPPRQPADSVRLVWREMRVEHTEEGVDTIYMYDVEPTRASQPTRDVWTFELGLGYGQLAGFESREPSLQLRGSVRDLPAISLYASYEDLGTYFGLRSGLMELTGLQMTNADGDTWKGSGKSFMAGVLAGQAWEVAGFNVFFEAAWTLRDFPSVEWSGSGLPTATPRDMNLSGWSIGTGVQFGVGG